MARLLLLTLAALMLQTSSAAPTYSGDWLAQELGMNTPEKAQEAIKAAAAGNVAPARAAAAAAASKVTPADAAQAEQRRQPYRALMASGRKEEALELIDNLIGQDEADGKSSVSIQTAYLRYDRIMVLRLLNRYIEALVELQRLRQLLETLGEPSGQLGEMAWRMEQELENMGDFQKLQLAPNSSKRDIRKSYKSLMMMLHPDKINSRTDLDERAKGYIADLYDKVRAAYDTLVAS